VTEVLDREFALSDAYAAHLFGAINYMPPGLPDHQISDNTFRFLLGADTVEDMPIKISGNQGIERRQVRFESRSGLESLFFAGRRHTQGTAGACHRFGVIH
jgi:hypothetical protein